MVQTTRLVRVTDEEVTIAKPEHASDYDRLGYGVDLGTILCGFFRYSG